jgi:hypothetical protein
MKFVDASGTQVSYNDGQTGSAILKVEFTEATSGLKTLEFAENGNAFTPNGTVSTAASGAGSVSATWTPDDLTLSFTVPQTGGTLYIKGTLAGTLGNSVDTKLAQAADAAGWGLVSVPSAVSVTLDAADPKITAMKFVDAVGSSTEALYNKGSANTAILKVEFTEAHSGLKTLVFDTSDNGNAFTPDPAYVSDGGNSVPASWASNTLTFTGATLPKTGVLYITGTLGGSDGAVKAKLVSGLDAAGRGLDGASTKTTTTDIKLDQTPPAITMQFVTAVGNSTPASYTGYMDSSYTGILEISFTTNETSGLKTLVFAGTGNAFTPNSANMVSDGTNNVPATWTSGSHTLTFTGNPLPKTGKLYITGTLTGTEGAMGNAKLDKATDAAGNNNESVAQAGITLDAPPAIGSILFVDKADSTGAGGSYVSSSAILKVEFTEAGSGLKTLVFDTSANDNAFTPDPAQVSDGGSSVAASWNSGSLTLTFTVPQTGGTLYIKGTLSGSDGDTVNAKLVKATDAGGLESTLTISSPNTILDTNVPITMKFVKNIGNSDSALYNKGDADSAILEISFTVNETSGLASLVFDGTGNAFTPKVTAETTADVKDASSIAVPASWASNTLTFTGNPLPKTGKLYITGSLTGTDGTVYAKLDKATDAAGNNNESVAQAGITLDTTAPAIDITGASVTGDGKTVSGIGIIENGSGVDWTSGLVTHNLGSTSDNPVFSQDGSNGKIDNNSISLTSSSPGTIVYTLTIQDNAGNQGTGTITVEVKADGSSTVSSRISIGGAVVGGINNFTRRVSNTLSRIIPSVFTGNSAGRTPVREDAGESVRRRISTAGVRLTAPVEERGNTGASASPVRAVVPAAKAQALPAARTGRPRETGVSSPAALERVSLEKPPVQDNSLVREPGEREGVSEYLPEYSSAPIGAGNPLETRTGEVPAEKNGTGGTGRDSGVYALVPPETGPYYKPKRKSRLRPRYGDM